MTKAGYRVEERTEPDGAFAPRHDLTTTLERARMLLNARKQYWYFVRQCRIFPHKVGGVLPPPSTR